MYHLQGLPAVMQSIRLFALQVGAEYMEIQSQNSKLSLCHTVTLLVNDTQRFYYGTR